jgi:hypothetical protein
MEAERVQSAIQQCYSTLPKASAPAGRTTEVLASAQASAVGLGHSFLGTEHVLLGMLASPQPTLEILLENLGLSCAQVRQETLAVIAQSPHVGSAKVQRWGDSWAPAIKAIVLAAMFLLLLTGIWALVSTSGRTIPQTSAVQRVDVPGARKHAGLAQGRKTTESFPPSSSRSSRHGWSSAVVAIGRPQARPRDLEWWMTVLN